MTILVTGANGMVGSRVVARLAAAGERVVAVGRGPWREPVRGVEYLECDFLEPRPLIDAIESVRPAGVLHAAAMTDVDACQDRPTEAWALNAHLVGLVALASRSAGARLTALSTDYVFDGVKGSYTEEEKPNPRGVYAESKHAGEKNALDLARDRAVCRVAVIFSGHKTAKRTFALSAAESLAAGQPVKAFFDQRVSPTLADNAAEMVIGVHRSREQGIFHCAGASEVTRVEFCQALARKLGADERLVKPVRMSDAKLRSPRPLNSGLRVDKVKRLLGERVPLSLDAALDRFLEERRA